MNRPSPERIITFINPASTRSETAAAYLANFHQRHPDIALNHVPTSADRQHTYAAELPDSFTERDIIAAHMGDGGLNILLEQLHRRRQVTRQALPPIALLRGGNACDGAATVDPDNRGLADLIFDGDIIDVTPFEITVQTKHDIEQHHALLYATIGITALGAEILNRRSIRQSIFRKHTVTRKIHSAIHGLRGIMAGPSFTIRHDGTHKTKSVSEIMILQGERMASIHHRLAYLDLPLMRYAEIGPTLRLLHLGRAALGKIGAPIMPGELPTLIFNESLLPLYLQVDGEHRPLATDTDGNPVPVPHDTRVHFSQDPANSVQLLTLNTDHTHQTPSY